MEEEKLTEEKEVDKSPEENSSSDPQCRGEKRPIKDDKFPEENSSSDPQCRGEKRSIKDSGVPELPSELKKMFKPLSCELCSVTVTSPVMAYAHYEGKPHLKNVNNYMKKHYNVESALKKQKTVAQPFKCEVCNIELTSELVYKMHLTGKQHRKNLKRNEVLPPKAVVEVDPTGRFNIGKAFIDETSSLVPEKSDLFCDLCQVFTNTKSQMEIHKQGQKHAKKAARNEWKQNSVVNSVQKSEECYNEKDVWEVAPDEEQNSN